MKYSSEEYTVLQIYEIYLNLYILKRQRRLTFLVTQYSVQLPKIT